MSARQQVDMSKRSIEYQPSETAMGTAFMRALAAMDEREEIRGPDYLAEIFLGEYRKRLLRDPAKREWVMKNKIAPGMYEFMIVRTAFFEHIVEQTLRRSIERIPFREGL